MVKINNYQVTYVCKECGHRIPMGDTCTEYTFLPVVCPKCGIETYSGLIPEQRRRKDIPYKKEVAKWVSTVELFKPSTWGTGYWKVKK
ncbi:MAG: hypothetical protein ACOCRK_10830 [bacterium]